MSVGLHTTAALETSGPTPGGRLRDALKPSAVLTVRSVSKAFAARPTPVRALREVDLDVVAGGLTAILGASGCGKTTLLRVIAGFDRPDVGEVRLGDRVLTAAGVHVPPEQRGIGIVPQEGALFPHLNVAQNVGFGLSGWGFGALSGRARRHRIARVAELLELVGLADYGARRPDELSGGQQQRVALARALAPRPQVVLLDEPFSALDAGLRAELREEVRCLLHKIGTTAVLVTHDQEEALSLADHIAVMRDAQVVQADSPRGVYVTPADAEVAAFIGEAVLLPGRLAAQHHATGPSVECALGCIAVQAAGINRAAHGECMVMLRPEQLELADVGIPARVIGTSFFGHDSVVRLRLGADGAGAAVQVRMQGHALPAIGDAVAVRVVEGATGCIAARAYQAAVS